MIRKIFNNTNFKYKTKLFIKKKKYILLTYQPIIHLIITERYILKESKNNSIFMSKTTKLQ